MRDPESISVNEDARLIPVWSIIVSIVAFVLVEFYFWVVLPEHQHHVPPLGLRIYFNISCGLLVALYFLMVGYISRDAPRRAMSARFWMVICLVMPGASARCCTFCCASRRFRGARRARHTCRATSTFARSAITN